MNQSDVLAESSVYLCAPVNALVEGIYEEHIPLSELRRHGDFGLGTFDHLDGEMVMLDGRIYQMGADGRVHVMDDSALTPFACVTFYRPMSQDAFDGEMAYEDFLRWLDLLLPSPNLLYAIRVEGVFSSVTVRSVPKQECYRPLVEVTRDQPVFTFADIEGTLAGFYTPSFMSSLNVPGLHLHFLSADYQHGGHLLSCRPRQARAGIQSFRKLELSLPTSLDYLTGDFRRDVQKDLDKAEK
jgi:acetolactate decarboxylase